MQVSFKMSDGLVIKGLLEGNLNSPDLVILLHSGGYDKDERGVKAKTKEGKKIYYNPKGNYEYLSAALKDDAAILRIDLRNHGESDKNIDIQKMLTKLHEIAPEIDYQTNLKICNLLHENSPISLQQLVSSLDISPNQKEKLNLLLKKPIVKDSSFITMKNDLKEIMTKFASKYLNYHFVGTCMGGLISTLYIMENPDKVASLSLLSPLFTLDDAFLNVNPKNEFSLKKQKAILKSGQFRMGNQVEGPKTYQEISQIRPTFYSKLNALNIPIYCLQGEKDQLISEQEQRKIFNNLIEYHQKNNLSPVYYATISPGVHSLYDVVYPSILEISNFIRSNLALNYKR